MIIEIRLQDTVGSCSMLPREDGGVVDNKLKARLNYHARVLFYLHVSCRYTGQRTSGSWIFRSSLSTLQHTRRVSDILCAILLDVIRLFPVRYSATAYAIGELGTYSLFSICYLRAHGWLTIWMALKGLILSETASISEALSWESINSFVWT
jgi:hypothetical protein